MALSTNTYIYAGGSQTFTVNFALGFIQRSDVKVRVNGAVDGAGDPVYSAFDWIDDSNITVTTILTTGDSVQIERTVSKTALKVNFAANADVTPSNLDLSAKHGLMVYQELVDGRVEGVESPIVAADRAVAAAAQATTQAAAAVVSAAAALVSEGLADADRVATNADVVLTNADVVLAEADKVQTGLDRIATAADVVSTNADVVLAEADKVQTGLDRVATAADKAATNADVVLTNADVVTTGNSVVAAANSAVAAAAALDAFDDRYLGAKATFPLLDNDGDALIVGALFFYTVADDIDNPKGMKTYDGTIWITSSAVAVASMVTHPYVATSAQTIFTGNDTNAVPLTYTVNNIIVLLNGVQLNATDFTATSGTSIVLTTGASTGDELVVVAFKSFTVADHYTQAQADALLAAKATVANVALKAPLASPTFTGNTTLSTGNLVIGTAGKGIDFSADGHAGGMTSEVLDDYEEGTWTPTLTHAGSNVATGTVTSAVYTKVGNLVYLALRFTALNMNTHSDNYTVFLSGLPFTPESGGSEQYQITTGGNSIDVEGGYIDGSAIRLIKTIKTNASLSWSSIGTTSGDLRMSVTYKAS